MTLSTNNSNLGQVEATLTPVLIKTYPTTPQDNSPVFVKDDFPVRAGFAVFVNVTNDLVDVIYLDGFAGFATLNESNINPPFNNIIPSNNSGVTVLTKGTIWVYNSEPISTNTTGLVIVINNVSTNLSIRGQYQIGSVCNNGNFVEGVTFQDISSVAQIRQGTDTIGGGVLIDVALQTVL